MNALPLGIVITLGFMMGNFSCERSNSNRAIIVRDGVNINACQVENSWKHTGGRLSGSGFYHLLYANCYLEDANFHLKANMSLERVDSTTALFLLFNNHFGFDSKADQDNQPGYFFFYSPAQKYYKRLDKADKHIRPGIPFLFEIIRRDSVFNFLVDGQSVGIVSAEVMTPPLEGVVAFRPWVNTINVYDWEIEGKLKAFNSAIDFVFEKGEAGYACFRIPAIVRTRSGKLLAFAEARKDNCWSDGGDIDLVMKTSTDGGTSWSPLQIVWNDGPHSCMAPTPILEEKTGSVVLLACRSRGDDDFKKFLAKKNKDERRVFVLRSSDEGMTWSRPKEITASVKFENWWWYGTGPGSAIQLRHKEYRGRLVAGAHFIEQKTNAPYAVGIHSDDHGISWKVGQPVPMIGGNESEVAELSDGTVMINARNSSASLDASKYGYGTADYRIVALSKDGGASWMSARRDTNLIEPVCQAS